MSPNESPSALPITALEVTVNSPDGDQLFSGYMELREGEDGNQYLTTGIVSFEHAGKRLKGALNLNGWKAKDPVKKAAKAQAIQQAQYDAMLAKAKAEWQAEQAKASAALAKQ